MSRICRSQPNSIWRSSCSPVCATEMHTVPGEHDSADATVTEYFNRFGKASDNKGYYRFDHADVHFVGLINVLQFRPGIACDGDETRRRPQRRSARKCCRHAGQSLRTRVRQAPGKCFSTILEVRHNRLIDRLPWDELLAASITQR